MREPLAAALAVAREHGLPTSEPRVLRDLTNVLVHLAPAPVVARVPQTFTLLRGREWFAQEVELAGFLAARGAAVAPPAADVDPGPHLHDGLLVTLWAYVDHDPDRGDPVVAGRSLRDLHDALAAYPGALPACDRAAEVAHLLGRLEPSPLASADELAAMRAACLRVSPLPSGQPLHGDAHLRNILWTREGPLWSDLENACSGPVEFDLASLLWRDIPGQDDALAAYGDYDPELVGAAEPALSLCLAAWTIVIALRVGAEGVRAEARRRVERALAYA